MARSRAALVLAVLTLAPVVTAFMPGAGAQQAPLQVGAAYSPPLRDDYWSNAPVNVSFFCEPSEGCNISYRPAGADVSYGPYTGPFLVSEDGQYSYDLSATNTTDHTATGSASFGIDTVAPFLNLTEPTCSNAGLASWCIGDVSFTTYALAEGGSGITNVTCTLGEDIVPCSDPCSECVQCEYECSIQVAPPCDTGCTFTVKSNGITPVAVGARDAAGNVANLTQTARIDRTAPTPPLASCSSFVNGWCRALLDISVASDAHSGVAEQSCSVETSSSGIG